MAAAVHQVSCGHMGTGVGHREDDGYDLGNGARLLILAKRDLAGLDGGIDRYFASSAVCLLCFDGIMKQLIRHSRKTNRL